MRHIRQRKRRSYKSKELFLLYATESFRLVAALAFKSTASLVLGIDPFSVRRIPNGLLDIYSYQKNPWDMFQYMTPLQLRHVLNKLVKSGFDSRGVIQYLLDTHTFTKSTLSVVCSCGLDRQRLNHDSVQKGNLEVFIQHPQVTKFSVVFL